MVNPTKTAVGGCQNVKNKVIKDCNFINLYNIFDTNVSQTTTGNAHFD